MNFRPDVHHLREFDARRRRQGNWLLAAILIVLLLGIWAVAAKADCCFIRDTGSMVGWVKPGGGFYALQRLPFDQVRVGMVIVYKHPLAGFVAHRVFWRDKKHIWTRGDSNPGKYGVPSPDSAYCTPENYLGVVSTPLARQP